MPTLRYSKVKQQKPQEEVQPSVVPNPASATSASRQPKQKGTPTGTKPASGVRGAAVAASRSSSAQAVENPKKKKEKKSRTSTSRDTQSGDIDILAQAAQFMASAPQPVQEGEEHAASSTRKAKLRKRGRVDDGDQQQEVPHTTASIAAVRRTKTASQAEPAASTAGPSPLKGNAKKESRKSTQEVINELVFGRKKAPAGQLNNDDAEVEEEEEEAQLGMLPSTVPAVALSYQQPTLGLPSKSPLLGPKKNPTNLGVALPTSSPSTTPRLGPKDVSSSAGAAAMLEGVDAEMSTEATKNFVKHYLDMRKADPNALGIKSAGELMEEANEYFRAHNAQERKRNISAMQRMREMKLVNRRGGDKEGFKYVVPKTHKQLLHLEKSLSADPEKELADPETKLRSHFGGDGVDDTMAKPMRKNKRKAHYKDDFYQIQTVQKWTKRAENFLGRTRKGRQMQQERMKAHRTIKKL